MSERPAVDKGTETPVQRHETIHELDGVLTTGETLENRLRPGRQIPGAPRNQIVTLAFLGSIPGIAELLAETLCAEADGPVVFGAFRNVRAGKRGSQPQRRISFSSPRNSEGRRGVPCVNGGVSQEEPPSTAGIVSLIAKLSRHFRHVLIRAEFAETSRGWLRELLVRWISPTSSFSPGTTGYLTSSEKWKLRGRRGRTWPD